MSYVSPSSSVYATNFVMRAVSNYFGNSRSRRARYQAVHSLNNLDPMVMKDIAVSRAEIHSVVYDISSDRSRRFFA